MYVIRTDTGSTAEIAGKRKVLTSNNSWIAYDKKGTKYTFGASTTAQLYAMTSPSNVYRWKLEEIRDSNNNYITYFYERDSETNQIYPKRILYTGSGSTNGIFQIDFTRATRTDTITSYRSGFMVRTADRITREAVNEVERFENQNLSHNGHAIFELQFRLPLADPARLGVRNQSFLLGEHFIRVTATSPVDADKTVVCWRQGPAVPAIFLIDHQLSRGLWKQGRAE